MKKLVVFSLATILIAGCNSGTKKMETELKTLIDTLEMKAKPAETGAALAYFNAAVTGKDEEYKKSSDFNIKVSKIYADTVVFARLREIKESGNIKDSLL